MDCGGHWARRGSFISIVFVTVHGEAHHIHVRAMMVGERESVFRIHIRDGTSVIDIRYPFSYRE